MLLLYPSQKCDYQHHDLGRPVSHCTSNIEVVVVTQEKGRRQHQYLSVTYLFITSIESPEPAKNVSGVLFRRPRQGLIAFSGRHDHLFGQT